MIHLDVKDKKLLFLLSENSRLSQTQLSQKIHLSKSAVKYRIQRLQKEGIITKFASNINLSSIKCYTFSLLLKFNEDIYENEKIIKYFQEHKFADWMVTLSGQWDIFVEFVIKNFSDMYQIIEEIISKFGEKLNTYQLFITRKLLRVEHLIEDFYKDIPIKSNIFQESKNNSKTEVYNLDETNKKILKILTEDSSLPFLQIAKKAKLTMDIVRYRIKELTKKGIIKKTFAEVSLKKLGYTEYLYILKIKNTSSEKMDQITKKIQNNKNITYAFTDANELKILFVCAFKNIEGIDSLSRNLRKTFPEIIDNQEYLIIKDQILFNLFPEGI